MLIKVKILILSLCNLATVLAESDVDRKGGLQRIRNAIDDLPLTMPAYLRAEQIEIDIESNDTVARIKERVEEKEGIPPAQQRLIFGGKQM
ncbi:hypothetical protein CcCBS67573_g09303 [Chytriomyces confervae]|uniref:Ubiquitin-like domain-containing protein n=1 Tax=Chytriomyces confervae TaxID=246404 RepID=A0A507E0E0_9FUNG|nr:hypothetical protein CcCBS67573_g09303 [Chytriomyces confervae]